MPLIKEWKTGNDSTAAIWKIEEPETFFLEATGIHPGIKNEKKRLEHLAGRYLLRKLEAEFPLHDIIKDEHGKPRLENNDLRFSVSHSWPYAAALVDKDDEAGIDIQAWHPRIMDIQHKFLAADELELLGNDIKMVTLAWCAKEAVYKWNGRRGIDFKEHMPITFWGKNGDLIDMTIYLKSNDVPKMVLIENIITADFACSWVARAQDWAIF